MEPLPTPVTTLAFLEGGGETGALIRRTNWAATPLGAPETWPAPLRYAVRFMLDAPIPLHIAWGPSFTFLYNDACIPLLGSRHHPQAMGLPALNALADVWPAQEPLYAAVLQGETKSLKNFKLTSYKDGQDEERFFDGSYIPIRNEDGTVGGLQALFTETTEKVAATDKQEAPSRRFQDMVMQAPVAIAVFRGADFVVEMANDAYLLLVDKKRNELEGKPFFDVLPELRSVVEPLFRQLMRTGDPLSTSELEVVLHRHGRTETGYFNSVWEPLYESDGRISGLMAVANEVTDQVRARKAVEENADRLNSLVSQVNAGIAQTHIDGRFRNVNDRFCEITGYAREELLHLSIAAITHPDDLPRNLVLLEACIRDGKSFFIEKRYIRKNGTVVWVTNSVTLVKESNGETTITAISINITEQMQARKKVEESETYFRRLTDAVPAIIWITAPDGACTYLNKNWYDYTGQTEEEAEGFGWLNATHPDDVEYAGKIFLEANEKRTPFTILYRLRNKTGEYRWAIDSGSPKFSADGVYEGMIGTVVDVHERKLAEEKLRASEDRYQNFVRRSSEGIWRFEVDGAIATHLSAAEQIDHFFEKAYLAECNDAMAQMYGYNTAEELIGMRLNDFFPRDADTEAYFNFFIESGYQVQDAESKELTKRGEIRYFSNNLIGITENGRLLRAWGTQRDITAQRAAEEQIRQSEAKLKSIIAAAPVAIGLFMGRDLIIEMPNQALIDVIGKGDTITGKPLREAMPELITEGQPFLQILDEVFTSGNRFQTFGSQVKIVQNGVMTNNYYNFTYTPLFDADGKVYAILDIAVDVTEQVRSQQRIEASEQQVRSLVESAPFPIGVYVGREMRIQLANQTLMDVWGKGGDVVGKLYSEILPELGNQQIFEQLDGVYTTGIPFRARNQRVDIVVDEKLRPFYFNYEFTPLFDAAGQVYGVMNTAADVTELNLTKQRIEESERNLRNMILQAPVAMCILKGPEHLIEIANERMFELWGKPADAVMHKPMFEALPEGSGQGFEKLLQAVFETGIAFKDTEKEVLLPRNGRMETLYLNFAFEPLYEGQGIVSGIMVVAIEVTDQVLARRKIEEVVAARTAELAQANETLIKTNQELSRSNTNLEEFAYAASHDLKEPVRKIHFFGDRLRHSLSDRVTDEENRFFIRMEMAAKRMGSLIDDLLSYSQINIAPRTFEEVNLNHLIDLVLSDLDLEIEEKKAKIEVANLFTIQAHHRQMQQAFHNLIGNALKYSKPGTPPEIRIRCSTMPGADTGLHLSPEEKMQNYHLVQVSDNGIGFDQRDAERIFNVFTRLHGNSEYRGTGVGLSIVRKVIENHSGYITAESSLGKGTTFKIYLPALKG